MCKCCFWSCKEGDRCPVWSRPEMESRQTEIFTTLIHILSKAMCSSSIWATAQTRQEQEAPLSAAGATFSRFFLSFFPFYWGEIFTIVFHSSPRNEYFCSLEFMGNAVNRLEICVWNENPWRTSEIELEEEKRGGG